MIKNRPKLFSKNTHTKQAHTFQTQIVFAGFDPTSVALSLSPLLSVFWTADDLFSNRCDVCVEREQYCVCYIDSDKWTFYKNTEPNTTQSTFFQSMFCWHFLPSDSTSRLTSALSIHPKNWPSRRWTGSCMFQLVTRSWDPDVEQPVVRWAVSLICQSLLIQNLWQPIWPRTANWS